MWTWSAWTGTVYSGPHYLRFESPESAAGYLCAWTDLEESHELTQQLAEGKTLETKGHSDVWLPLVYFMCLEKKIAVLWHLLFWILRYSLALVTSVSPKG